MNIFQKFNTMLSGLKPSQYRPMWQLYNYDSTKKYVVKEKNAGIIKTPYMEDDTLCMQVDGKIRKIQADPNIKHLYNALFPSKKNRMILDLSLKLGNSLVFSKAQKSAIDIWKMVKGIHLCALKYFNEIKKDEQEVEYLLKVLSNTPYFNENFPEMEQYISDYFIKGLYTMGTKSSRDIRVGKILHTVKETGTRAPVLLYAIKNYNLVKVLSLKNTDLIIVLSRHPYDIASMSTNRGWTSCTNLYTGQCRHYVPSSIAGGVLIAYLCNKDDTNINRPLGRVLIKPCIRAGEKIQVNPTNFILRCSKAYGTFLESHIDQLQDWLDKNWNNKVKVTPGRYELTKMAYQENEDKDWEYTEDGKWKKHHIHRSRL